MCTVKYGNKFANVTGTAGGVTQVLDPADNVGGAVIRTLMLQLSAIGTVFLFTGTAAPVGNSGPVAFRATSSSGSHTSALPEVLELPPGYGLWLSSSVVTAVNMSYDLYMA